MDSDESVSRGVVSDNFGFMAWGHCQLQEVFADIMYRVEYTRNSQDQLSVLLWTTLPVPMKHIYDLVELWNEGRDVKSRLTLIWVDGDENLLVFNRRRRCAEHPFFKYMEQERLKKVLPWVMGGTGSNWDQVTVQRMDSEADDEADDLYCAPYSYREVELHREAQALRTENARLERTMEDERLEEERFNRIAQSRSNEIYQHRLLILQRKFTCLQSKHDNITKAFTSHISRLKADLSDVKDRAEAAEGRFAALRDKTDRERLNNDAMRYTRKKRMERAAEVMRSSSSSKVLRQSSLTSFLC